MKVYRHFCEWKHSGLYTRPNKALRGQVRRRAGKNPVPTAAIIDFRSVKTSEKGAKGYDDGKKIKGRKRHPIDDTLGLLQKFKVLPANLSDPGGGKQLLEEVHNDQPALKLHLVCRRRVSGDVGGLGEVDRRLHRGNRQTL